MKLLFALAAVVPLFVTTPALAEGDDSVRECKAEAKEILRTCKTVCKEEFRMDKDECLARDHECAEACRAGRDACLAAILLDLEACIGPCNEAKRADKEVCRSLYERDTVERDRCIDAAQLVAFQCRDECRENVEVGPRTRLCRDVNKACLKACPSDDD